MTDLAPVALSDRELARLSSAATLNFRRDLFAALKAADLSFNAQLKMGLALIYGKPTDSVVAEIDWADGYAEHRRDLQALARGARRTALHVTQRAELVARMIYTGVRPGRDEVAVVEKITATNRVLDVRADVQRQEVPR